MTKSKEEIISIYAFDIYMHTIGKKKIQEEWLKQIENAKPNNKGNQK